MNRTILRCAWSAAALAACAACARDFDIRDFGAVGDGKTLNTSAIQKTIDMCSAEGGGRVIVDGGTYVTGTVLLKSGVELHVEANAVLMGSPDWRDWKDQPDARHIDTYMCPRHRSAALIFADEAENIAITGRGTIHGNGMAFVEKDPSSASGQLRRRLGVDKSPPRLVLFAGCRRVKVLDVSISYPPAGWSFWVHDCDDVVFDRVSIVVDVDFPNADGIHVNCSRDVRISNCDIETGDDSIVVRANSASLKENKPCERVSVANCNLRSYSSGVRIGWINDGVIRDCAFSNLTIRDSVCGIGLLLPYGGSREKTPDQGREATLVENLSFSNIVMDRIYARPVYVEITTNASTRVEAVRNLRFTNITSRGLMPPMVSAPRQGIVSDILFDGCRFEIDPAGKSAYRNGGEVGFASCQRFEGREHGRNVENMLEKPDRRDVACDVAAYVWPAYQPEPRWAELGIFGDGKGEWQNVCEATKRKPCDGLDARPLWGCEDESDPAVVARKIDAATAAGVNVFIYDWYWYGGRPFLEAALDRGFLGAKNCERMKFFIMWANHDVNGLWDNKMSTADGKKNVIWPARVSDADFEKIADRWISMYFSRANYYRIDGRPVLSIYDIKGFVDWDGPEKAKERLAYLRARVKAAGFPGLHLQAVGGYLMETAGDALSGLGVDSFTSYSWNDGTWSRINDETRPECTYPEWCEMAFALWDRYGERARTLGAVYFPNLTVGWDTNARYPTNETRRIVCNSNPADFARAARRVRAWADANVPATLPRLITVNSWNEWTEGSYLEPDDRFGYGYLDALRNVFGR